MPEVGKVTEVEPVVSKLKALVAEKVITSPPPKVMLLVARVVESDAVRVLPAPKVKVPVPVVMVLPFKVVKVPAPPLTAPVPALMELSLVTIPLVQVPAISNAVVPVPVLPI